jgi:hypothetical protein
LHERTFDLLITDLRLPGIDGLELLARARQIYPVMPMLLITAYGSPQVEARARELDSAFLPKPFGLRDLLRQVDDILSAKPAVSPPVAEGQVAFPLEAHPPGESLPEKCPGTRAIHFKVVACDLDGTLAENGQVDPETWEVLRSARRAGFELILVTGRTLDSFTSTLPFAELCGAIVAENGAVVYFPRRGSVVVPFGRLDSVLVQRLQALGVPLERGLAIVATRMPHDETVFKMLREVRAPLAVEYNRDAVMLLPPGASKGQGLMVALQELGYSPHNVLVCGDAENDRSLFEVAELAAAVSNAQPGLRAVADILLPQPDGEGVRELLKTLIEGKQMDRKPRSARRFLLGYRMSGAPLYFDPFILAENNLGIFGSSGSGKSWLAGLLVEELLKQKYQVCVIDPEGDYRGLGVSPNALLLGGSKRSLPSVEDVLNLLEWKDVSLVLDLSMVAMDERLLYVEHFLQALKGLRARRGRPHHILVDEVQLFCPSGSESLTGLFLDSMQWGGFTIVSYRISQIAPELLNALEVYLITRLRLQEELDTLQPHLEGGEILEQLRTLPQGYAYLSQPPSHEDSGADGGMIRFRVGPRSIPHVRHLYKYLRSPLPEWKRFYFHTAAGLSSGRTAGNLWEFRIALGEVPVESISYHSNKGDFEAWLRDVLHDEELARRVRKVSDRGLEDESLRQALLDVVLARYNELEAYA